MTQTITKFTFDQNSFRILMLLVLTGCLTLISSMARRRERTLRTVMMTMTTMKQIPIPHQKRKLKGKKNG